MASQLSRQFVIGRKVFSFDGNTWRCTRCGETGVRTLKALRHARVDCSKRGKRV